MAGYQTIQYEVKGRQATIRLNRPDNLNGITPTLMRELYECTSRVADDANIRVVKLTGAGRGFCPGADLKVYSSGEKLETGHREYFHITSLLHETPKVTVAAINGAGTGTGFGWACACDLRYATQRASFNTAFLGVAISGDMAGLGCYLASLAPQKHVNFILCRANSVPMKRNK